MACACYVLATHSYTQCSCTELTCVSMVEASAQSVSWRYHDGRDDWWPAHTLHRDAKCGRRSCGILCACRATYDCAKNMCGVVDEMVKGDACEGARVSRLPRLAPCHAMHCSYNVCLHHPSLLGVHMDGAYQTLLVSMSCTTYPLLVSMPCTTYPLLVSMPCTTYPLLVSMPCTTYPLLASIPCTTYILALHISWSIS
jgi:hypothetical protein